jgi:hypothetical protein
MIFTISGYVFCDKSQNKVFACLLVNNLLIVKKQLLQEACYGFPTAAVTRKVVPKAGHECTYNGDTNDREAKPEQKFNAAFGILQN